MMGMQVQKLTDMIESLSLLRISINSLKLSDAKMSPYDFADTVIQKCSDI